MRASIDGRHFPHDLSGENQVCRRKAKGNALRRKASVAPDMRSIHSIHAVQMGSEEMPIIPAFYA
ncbi:MAG TPA: hypothetical protein VFV47_04095 [Hyphomicrobiaceae bacterium]|nr:hypothetical protein [Hyphomicrobiaceae bacterium]